MARAKLGEILMQRGVIDAATLKRALGEQVRFAAQKFKLGQILVDMKVCSWTDVGQALSQQLGVPFADLATADEAAVKLLPVELCEKHRAVAFARDPGPPDVVKVAFADPSDLAAVDAVRFRLGKPMRAAIGAPDAIQSVIDRVHKGIQGGIELGGMSLEDDLFGTDDDSAMSVEHFGEGSLRMPEVAEASGGMQLEVTPVAGIALSTEESFDALFSGSALPQASPPKPAPASSPRPVSASAAVALGDPFGGLTAPVATPAVVPAAPPPAMELAPEPAEIAEPTTPRVAVHLFVDRRVKEVRPPPPPPAAKPTLVLTSEALFGPGAAEPSAATPGEAKVEGADPMPELSAEVMGAEVVEEVEAMEAEPLDIDEPTVDTGARALFEPHFDASNHPDPMHPTQAAEPDGKALFGAQLEAEPHPDAPVDLDPMPELAAPQVAAEDPELNGEDIDFGEMAVEPEPATAAPEPEPELEPTLTKVEAAPPEPELEPTLTKVEAAPPEPKPVPTPARVEAAPPEPKPVPTPAKVEAAPPEPKPVPTPAKVEAAEDKSDSLASLAERPLTAEELRVVEVIEQLADGAIEDSPVKQAKPAHMIAALVRLLIRQGVIREGEFLEELTRK